MDKRYYKWTVEIAIHPIWVADGFNLTQERLQDMLERELGYARSDEIETRVVKAPHEDQIRAEQGCHKGDHKPRLCNCGSFRDRCGCQ